MIHKSVVSYCPRAQLTRSFFCFSADPSDLVNRFRIEDDGYITSDARDIYQANLVQLAPVLRGDIDQSGWAELKIQVSAKTIGIHHMILLLEVK